jgi:hypothetical protein
MIKYIRHNESINLLTYIRRPIIHKIIHSYKITYLKYHLPAALINIITEYVWICRV